MPQIVVDEEMLEDGKNVYKAKNIDEFEEKIRGVITGKLSKVGENAYKVAEERDIKKVGEQLKKVYEEVLKD